MSIVGYAVGRKKIIRVKKMSEVKLNLGCGSDIRDDFINLDMFPVDDRVLSIDLNVLPLPFEDDSVDYIVLHQILEHLDVNPYDFMMDVFRVLKKDGIVDVGLPVYCNSIVHHRYQHNVSYFEAICAKSSTTSDRFASDFFRLNGVRKKRRSLKSVLMRFVEMFKDCLFVEYEYELVKNKAGVSIMKKCIFLNDKACHHPNYYGDWCHNPSPELLEICKYYSKQDECPLYRMGG
jgi:predicted SAM-dependent methyltransferase